MAHLDEHKLLEDRQHVYKQIHSYETQLTMVINDWAKFWTIKDKVDAFNEPRYVISNNVAF